MRKYWLCVATFLMSMSMFACAGEIGGPGPSSSYTPYAEPQNPQGQPQVRLWSTDHPLLRPYDVVLDGCRGWWPNDIDCVLTDAFDATMFIVAVEPTDVTVGTDQAYADMANCVPDADGSVTLAIAKTGGWIDVFVKCFERRDADGNLVGYDWLSATAVVTHEVGHELGLPHVPEECDANALKDDFGRRVCGDAIMNPSISLAEAPAPTEVDDALFRIFAERARLPASAVETCVYRTR